MHVVLLRHLNSQTSAENAYSYPVNATKLPPILRLVAMPHGGAAIPYCL